MGIIPAAALALALLAAPSPVHAEEIPPLPLPEVVPALPLLPAPEALQEVHIPRSTASHADESIARQTTIRSLLIIIGLAVAVGALLVVAFG